MAGTDADTAEIDAAIRRADEMHAQAGKQASGGRQ
jgi:hypothetical protein